jgi:ribosomal protein S18 acetylase RimI-like enzyme
MRVAELTDAPALAELWSDAMRRADHRDLIGDLELIIKAAAASPEQRVVVAEYDGVLAGAVLLRVATLTALNLDPTVQAVSPHVFPQFRRRGIGQALMETAVAFAEEIGIGHVTTAASAGSRDANRFMARLALGPHATLRVAPTHAVRAKLTAQRPATASTTNGRQLTRVLVARRSMRRSQSAR